jgi:hypothetical protein
MLVESDNKLPQQFCVFGKDHEDRTYFIKNMTLSEYLWCYAEKKLTLGQQVYGEIKPPQHPEDFPMLIICSPLQTIERKQVQELTQSLML